MGRPNAPSGNARRHQDLRDRLGPVGVYLSPPDLPLADELAAARSAEALGYCCLWFGEALGREAFAHAAVLLGATERAVVGLGIANLWARDPMATMGGARTLLEAWPDRLLLGVGISHDVVAERRGHRFRGSASLVAEYLEAMSGAPYTGPAGSHPPLLVAALGPLMIQVARRLADGAISFFSPVEHTRRARRALGDEKLLVVGQAVVEAGDIGMARAAGDPYCRLHLGLPNFRNNLRRLGYDASALVDAGSTAVFDDVIAWGDDVRIAQRIAEHRAAGADHVALHLVTPWSEGLPLLERLATQVVG